MTGQREGRRLVGEGQCPIDWGGVGQVIIHDGDKRVRGPRKKDDMSLVD